MHVDKHRDMARSILPSKAPRSARHDLAAVKRHHRRTVRADLRALRREHHDDTSYDLTRTADREINQIRRQRRNRDKLNHFERWAVEVTKHMPVEDRLGWLRSVLPGGLIGDHAMSHLDWIPELRAYRQPRDLRESWAERKAAWRDLQHRRRARLSADLHLVLERPGGHREINLALRSVEHDGDPPGPRLHGVHDVGGLVDALICPPDGSTEQYVRPRPDHPALPAVRKVLAEIVDGREGA